MPLRRWTRAPRLAYAMRTPLGGFARVPAAPELGRATGRESVLLSVVAVSFKNYTRMATTLVIANV